MELEKHLKFEGKMNSPHQRGDFEVPAGVLVVTND